MTGIYGLSLCIWQKHPTKEGNSIKIILASSSEYRRTLLQRFNLPFTSISPDIDESPRLAESPTEQVIRLAIAKAGKVSEREAEALIIGSDQLAVLAGSILGKPGSHSLATQQLQAMRGQSVCFYTGLCVLNTVTAKVQYDCIAVDVKFRDYSDELIERYLLAEQPYHCAGSFKSEQLGIILVERIECLDPTALIGLPLIRLSEMLANEGVVIP